MTLGMKQHVPDLERCKRMKEMGFPQRKAKFYWVTDHADAAWVEYSQSEFYNSFDIIAAAPIATELVEEIRKIDPTYSIIICVSPEWCRVGFAGCHFKQADTLPNALADLWMALKGENHE